MTSSSFLKKTLKKKCSKPVIEAAWTTVISFKRRHLPSEILLQVKASILILKKINGVKNMKKTFQHSTTAGCFWTNCDLQKKSSKSWVCSAPFLTKRSDEDVHPWKLTLFRGEEEPSLLKRSMTSIKLLPNPAERWIKGPRIIQQQSESLTQLYILRLFSGSK